MHIDRIIVSCEHASAHVPRAYARRLPELGALLGSHRGFDAGAAELARRLARAIGAPLFLGGITRLLVDLNRAESNRTIFSRISRTLPIEERAALLRTYYRPHREAVEAAVRRALAGGRTVLHVSVHSFTPVLDGVVRRAGVGLLYDPRRTAEAALCGRWRAELVGLDPTLVVRRNYPYRGTSDGLTRHLRRTLGTRRYLGIELEVNGSYPRGPRAAWQALQRRLIESLRRARA